MAEYAHDQDLKNERERLAGMERLWDPGSREILARVESPRAGAASRSALAAAR